MEDKKEAPEEINGRINGREPLCPDPMRGAEPSFINQNPHGLPTGEKKPSERHNFT